MKIPRKLRPEFGSYHAGSTQLVNNAELQHPPFVRAVRNHCAKLGITASSMLDHLTDLYRDLRTPIIDAHGFERYLDMAPLETDPDDMDLLDSCQRSERIRDWFRTMNKPVPENVTPYVRGEARERFRVLATIIIATNPNIDWPRILPANNNINAVNDNF